MQRVHGPTRAPFEVSKVTSNTSRFSTCSTSHTPSAHGHQAAHAAMRTLIRRMPAGPIWQTWLTLRGQCNAPLGNP